MPGTTLAANTSGCYKAPDMTHTKVVIIGAGPIGLELAAAFKHAGVDYLQFEAGQIGQTISWFPKMTRFFSSPDRIAISGVPLQTADQSKATREEYLAYLRGIVAHFDLKVHTYERVTEIQQKDEGFEVHTNRQGTPAVCWAPHLVLAVGDMAHPRLLHIPGEDLEHVDHYFDEPHRYFQKKVLIVGGKNSAVEAAIRCHRANVDVAISYRHDRFDPDRVKYWLLPEIQMLIKTGGVGFYPDTVPKAITANQVQLQPVGPTHGDPVWVDADFVLLLTGYVMDQTLFKMIDVELVGENQSPSHNPQTMQTNVPGVYVAGTAVAGTQKTFKLFIENCHRHVRRIVAAITGAPPPAESGDTGQPED